MPNFMEQLPDIDRRHIICDTPRFQEDIRLPGTGEPLLVSLPPPVPDVIPEGMYRCSHCEQAFTQAKLLKRDLDRGSDVPLFCSHKCYSTVWCRERRARERMAL